MLTVNRRRHNVEVDFYVPSKGLAVQACWSMADAATARREVAALEKLNAHAPLKRRIIVTREQRDSITLSSGQTIDVLPLADWLLQN